MWFIARIFAATPVWLLDAFAWILAGLAFDILRLRRSLILSNIGIAFPELSMADKQRIGRASLYHFVVTVFETFRAAKHSYFDHTTLRNRHIMDDAFAKGRGVYLLCIHSGNFEALGGMASHEWAPATVPVKFVGRGGVDRYIHEQRCRYKIRPVRVQKPGEGYLAIRQALQEGRPVGFMLDQSRPGQPRLPLFGRPAKTNTSLAAIWKKCEAPLVPLYCKRLAFGEHEVRFFPELQLVCSDDPQEDVLAHSIEYNKCVEMMIRDCPEQYWWIHNRWK